MLCSYHQHPFLRAGPASLSAMSFAEEERPRLAGGQLQEGLRRALGPSASALQWQQAATAMARQRSAALPMSADMARSPSGDLGTNSGFYYCELSRG
jgi:hypothetical protein